MTDAINKMNQGKADGPLGVIVEMIKAGGRETVTAISELVNQIISKKNTTEVWNYSFIINCYKGKGNAIDCGN